jgi:hypothetical protein
MSVPCKEGSSFNPAGHWVWKVGSDRAEHYLRRVLTPDSQELGQPGLGRNLVIVKERQQIIRRRHDVESTVSGVRDSHHRFQGVLQGPWIAAAQAIADWLG